MRRAERLAAAAIVVLCQGSPARAAKPDDGFKNAFKETWKGRGFGSKFSNERGPVETWAVLLKPDVKAASIYGQTRWQGQPSFECYDSDIVGGELRDPNPAKQQKKNIWEPLARGEILGLQTVSFGDGKVELWLHSVALRKVTRKDNKRGEITEAEPYCANLRFQLPSEKARTLGAAEVPAALEYVAAWTKPFKSRQEAEAFAKTLAAPRKPPARR